jgi:hypothetical protein
MRQGEYLLALADSTSCVAIRQTRRLHHPNGRGLIVHRHNQNRCAKRTHGPIHRVCVHKARHSLCKNLARDRMPVELAVRCCFIPCASNQLCRRISNLMRVHASADMTLRTRIGGKIVAAQNTGNMFSPSLPSAGKRILAAVRQLTIQAGRVSNLASICQHARHSHARVVVYGEKSPTCSLHQHL